MSDGDRRCPFASRRALLAATAGLAGAIVSHRARADAAPATPAERVPFRGRHQAGILTPQQSHVYFAAFDVTTPQRDALITLLRSWTDAAERLTAGTTAAPLSADPAQPGADSGEVLGLGPARLTLTFGFGPGLFERNGADRFGLAARRPAPLAELPRFNGDQLVAERSGGDLAVQACADDPQIAFHAVRQLARLAYGAAQLRWVQAGFLPRTPAGETPRNLMGFKDGTNNPAGDDAAATVWAGAEAPSWLQGGSYLVARRIRIALEHWDRTEIDFQEQTMGRRKYSGAPLGANHEFDPLPLDATNADGDPVIPENAHVRLGAPASHGGARILRRGYAYDDGVSVTAERWPPWRQGLEYDAGLFFLAYQRDPQDGFVRIFEPMAKLDALNQFTTHTASALFACPRGIQTGEFIGEALFASG